MPKHKCYYFSRISKIHQKMIESSCQLKNLFTFLKTLLGSQEALQKKSRRPTALDTHAHSQLNSFVKPETFWDGMWYGVAANLTLTPVSGCGCCTYSSAVANRISPCVTSDLQTMGCQPPEQETPIRGSATPNSDRNLAQNYQDHEAAIWIHPQLATAGGKENAVPILPLRTTLQEETITMSIALNYSLLPTN